MAIIEGDIASAVPKQKTRDFKYLNENAPVQGPGHNCRAGNNCRAYRAFSSEMGTGSRQENASKQKSESPVSI
jgi:hypothetical protein